MGWVGPQCSRWRSDFLQRLAHAFDGGARGDETPLEMQDVHGHAGLGGIAIAAVELGDDPTQAGLEFGGAAVDGFGRIGVEAEQAVDAGGQRPGLGLAVVGHLLHEPDRLQQAGEGEDAIFHAARFPCCRSRRASVRSDDCSAQAFVVLVEDDRLTWRDGALRSFETDADAAVASDAHRAGLVVLAVAGLGGAARTRWPGALRPPSAPVR